MVSTKLIVTGNLIVTAKFEIVEFVTCKLM